MHAVRSNGATDLTGEVTAPLLVIAFARGGRSTQRASRCVMRRLIATCGPLLAAAPVTRGKSLQKAWFAPDRAGRTVSHWVVVRWFAVGVEEDDP